MTTIPLDERLAEAVAMREGGQVAEARNQLLELCREHPDDPRVNLQCAWAHDKLGMEREAVPFYETAIGLGLEGRDLQDAVLGLGSTYRALGDYDKAARTLALGVEEFPEDRAMAVFWAMALYNDGEPKEACQRLLAILLETTADAGILRYREALETYAADLDQVWA